MWRAAFERSAQPVTQALLHEPILPPCAGFEKVSAALAVRSALAAKRTPQTLFVVVPAASAATARYVVAALLVGNFAHENGASSRLPAEEATRLFKKDVLFVTLSVAPTIALLSDLSIGTEAKLGDMWQVESFSKYARGRAAKPRVLITNPGWIGKGPPPPKFGAIVVDASHPRTLDRLNLILGNPDCQSPLRIVVAPPLSERQLSTYGYPGNVLLWFWDPQAKNDAAALTKTSGESPEANRGRLVWSCDGDPEVNGALSEVSGLLATTLRNARGSEVPGLGLVWGLFHRLRQLAVPLTELEQSSANAWGGNLRARIESLDSVAAPGNPLWETAWPKLKGCITNAYQLLLRRQEPTKFWVIASLLEQSLKRIPNSPVRVVVPSRNEVTVLVRILEQLVDGFRNARAEGHIEVVSSNDEAKLISIGSYAHTILPGPRLAHWRYLDIYPPFSTELLAYPFELELEAGAHARLYRFVGDLQSSSARQSLLASFGLHVPAGFKSEERPQVPSLVCQAANGQVVRLKTDAAIEGAIDIDALAEPTMSDALRQLDVESGLASTQDRSTVGEVTVRFSNGTTERYPASHKVDVFFPATDQLTRENVALLQPGWHVISFVDGRYDDLFERLAEAVHQKLQTRERAALELWKEAKSGLLRQFKGDRRQLFAHLSENGLTSDYATVTSWFKGGDEVLAPQQYDNYVIVAKATGAYTSGLLMDSTFTCIQSERGRQRTCGRVLSGFLRALYSQDSYEDALESARKIGSEIADVLAAVELLEVRDVDVSVIDIQTMDDI